MSTSFVRLNSLTSALTTFGEKSSVGVTFGDGKTGGFSAKELTQFALVDLQKSIDKMSKEYSEKRTDLASLFDDDVKDLKVDLDNLKRQQALLVNILTKKDSANNTLFSSLAGADGRLTFAELKALDSKTGPQNPGGTATNGADERISIEDITARTGFTALTNDGVFKTTSTAKKDLATAQDVKQPSAFSLTSLLPSLLSGKPLDIGSLLPALIGDSDSPIAKFLPLLTQKPGDDPIKTLLPLLLGDDDEDAGADGDDSSIKDLLPILLLSSQGGAGGGGDISSILPLLLLSGKDGEDSDIKDLLPLILIMSMNKPAPAAPAAPAAPGGVPGGFPYMPPGGFQF